MERSQFFIYPYALIKPFNYKETIESTREEKEGEILQAFFVVSLLAPQMIIPSWRLNCQIPSDLSISIFNLIFSFQDCFWK